MIRYTFAIFLALFFFAPSAHSTDTDEKKVKALETELKNLEKERKELRNILDIDKKGNAETKEKLKEIKRKNNHILKNKQRYYERHGKSKVDTTLIKINNAIHRGERQQKREEKQINKTIKIIQDKDRIILNKKIAYERMKQTLIEKKNKVTIYIKEINFYVEAGDNLRYSVVHFDVKTGKPMGGGIAGAQVSKDLPKVYSDRAFIGPNCVIEVFQKDTGKKLREYQPIFDKRGNVKTVKITDLTKGERVSRVYSR